MTETIDYESKYKTLLKRVVKQRFRAYDLYNANDIAKLFDISVDEAWSTLETLSEEGFLVKRKGHDSATDHYKRSEQLSY